MKNLSEYTSILDYLDANGMIDDEGLAYGILNPSPAFSRDEFIEFTDQVLENAGGEDDKYLAQDTLFETYHIPFEINGKKYGLSIMYGQGSAWTVYTDEEFQAMKERMAELYDEDDDELDDDDLEYDENDDEYYAHKFADPRSPGKGVPKMNQYVIYEKPKDHPTKFVVRQWIIGPGTAKAGPMISTSDTLEEAQATLPEGLTNIPRFANDDPVIVEVWM